MGKEWIKAPYLTKAEFAYLQDYFSFQDAKARKLSYFSFQDAKPEIPYLS